MNKKFVFNKKTIFQDKYRDMVDRMVELRKKRGLTQRELAQKMRVTHCCVGRVETYERRLDIMETIRWLRVLKLSDDEIIEFLKQVL
ncbi:MAG: helix-turn-helix transcriptional regulator [Alphaproteobacteria bacterium]|nr:helix-turn-helix transcriptional regulator [Alphaproteobacteria bacterium]